MSHLSAHLGYLFADLPLESRPEAARDAGFGAIEHPQPFAVSANVMRSKLDDLGMSFTQLCAGTGDGAKGEKGIAALPGREREFLESLERSLDYAEAVGCRFVHPMAGVVPSDVEPRRADETYRRNIHAAVERARGRPVSILIEAIGQGAVPRYHMHRLDQAFVLSRSFDVGSVSVLLDTFHAAANSEDAVALIQAHSDRLGHIHVADHPGRHEPGTGAIDFGPLLAALRRANYAGAIGFEYIPSRPGADGMSFLADFASLEGHPQ